MALFPLETVRTRIAVHHGAYKGIGDCIRQTVAKEGVKGLYQVWSHCCSSRCLPELIDIIPWAVKPTVVTLKDVGSDAMVRPAGH